MVVFRKLLSAELGEVRSHLLRLELKDRYARFSGIASEAVIERYCRRLAQTRAVVVGYFDRGLLRGIGEVLWVQRNGTTVGELAFSVEQAYQGQGVGTALMTRALQAARNRRLLSIELVCQPDNRRMLRLARHFGCAPQLQSGEVQMTLTLPPPTPLSLTQETIEESNALFLTLADQWQGVLLDLLQRPPLVKTP